MRFVHLLNWRSDGFMSIYIGLPQSRGWGPNWSAINAATHFAVRRELATADGWTEFSGIAGRDAFSLTKVPA